MTSLRESDHRPTPGAAKLPGGSSTVLELVNQRFNPVKVLVRGLWLGLRCGVSPVWERLFGFHEPLQSSPSPFLSMGAPLPPSEALNLLTPKILRDVKEFT